jgi:NADPH:quinone reductase-like Zn-dependent oxidoreductase
MRAWRYANGATAKTRVGKLEESIALDVEAPAPDKSSLAEEQLLIRVLSASLNPADYKMPESDWFGRLFGLGSEAQPGLDFCGRVVGKHPLNTANSDGQRVFGSLAKASRYGALGDFVVASASEVAAVPDGVTDDQAAALGTSAGIAYKSLQSAGIKPGSHVLINGGSGGVGTYSIQLAKLMGAEVTTCTSASHVELVLSLGADHVIDYRTTDVIAELRRRGPVFDAVVDNVGTPNDLYDQCHGFLKNAGIYVQVAASPTARATCDTLAALSKSFVMPGRRTFRFATDKGASSDYALLARWVAEGKLKPVIGRSFGFDDVALAYAELRKGRSTGKIVVHVSVSEGGDDGDGGEAESRHTQG